MRRKHPGSYCARSQPADLMFRNRLAFVLISLMPAHAGANMDALRLPFWEMIGTAEAIVIGEREGWSVSDGEYLALAQVHVLERLKGVASGRLLVPADPTWSERLVRYLGARPFRREPHVRIQILFLAPASAHLRYRSLIDWGVIEPSLADLAVFRETILVLD